MYVIMRVDFYADLFIKYLWNILYSIALIYFRNPLSFMLTT